MAIIVWVPSIFRVVGAFARSEVFGVEATLALVCVIGAPIWLVSALRSRSPALEDIGARSLGPGSTLPKETGQKPMHRADSPKVIAFPRHR